MFPAPETDTDHDFCVPRPRDGPPVTYRREGKQGKFVLPCTNPDLKDEPAFAIEIMDKWDKPGYGFPLKKNQVSRIQLMGYVEV